MDAEFWKSRWAESRIGFHQDRPTPLMLKHWPSLDVEPGERVFVPLCGKSLDMAWFASQGLRVLGVELSPIAVRQFFEESALEPETRVGPFGLHHRCGAIEIIEGDVFGLDVAALADSSAVFDRAALIALPHHMRPGYVESVYGRLPAGCRGLLITLEFSADEKPGPPFPVDEAEVRHSFGRFGSVELLERRDILQTQAAFLEAGVTALHTAVYRFDRR